MSRVIDLGELLLRQVEAEERSRQPQATVDHGNGWHGASSGDVRPLTADEQLELAELQGALPDPGVRSGAAPDGLADSWSRPLQKATVDLARSGDRAIAAMRRFVERYGPQPGDDFGARAALDNVAAPPPAAPGGGAVPPTAPPPPLDYFEAAAAIARDHAAAALVGLQQRRIDALHQVAIETADRVHLGHLHEDGAQPTWQECEHRVCCRFRQNLLAAMRGDPIR